MVKTPDPLIIFDFDSTFINAETLDTLADIAYASDPRHDEVVKHVAYLTELTMAGQCSLHQALVERMKFLKLRREHVIKAIALLKNKVSTSFVKNKHFIRQNAKNIMVFSGGFSEIIIPIVADYGILEHQVYANHFVYDGDLIVNVDESGFMVHGDGKAKQLTELAPKGKVYIIGDGSNDAAAKQSGLVTEFYLFTENVYRETVAPLADKIIVSLDDFIKDFQS